MSLKKHTTRRATASLALLSAFAIGMTGLVAAPAMAFTVTDDANAPVTENDQLPTQAPARDSGEVGHADRNKVTIPGKHTEGSVVHTFLYQQSDKSVDQLSWEHAEGSNPVVNTDDGSADTGIAIEADKTLYVQVTKTDSTDLENPVVTKWVYAFKTEVAPSAITEAADFATSFKLTYTPVPNLVYEFFAGTPGNEYEVTPEDAGGGVMSVTIPVEGMGLMVDVKNEHYKFPDSDYAQQNAWAPLPFGQWSKTFTRYPVAGPLAELVGDKLTITEVEGVIYEIGGEQITDYTPYSPMTLAYGQSVTVTARAAAGYELPSFIPDEWVRHGDYENGIYWTMTVRYGRPPAPPAPVTPPEQTPEPEPEAEQTPDTQPETAPAPKPTFEIPTQGAVGVQIGEGEGAVVGYQAGNTFILPDAEDPTKPGESITFGKATDQVSVVQTKDGPAFLAQRGNQVFVSDGVSNATKQALTFGKPTDKVSVIAGKDGPALVAQRGNRVFVSDGLSSETKQVLTFGKPSDNVSVVATEEGPALVAQRGNKVFVSDGLSSGTKEEVTFGRPTDDVSVITTDEGPAVLAVRGNQFHISDGLSSETAQSFSFGRPTDQVFVGDWDGDGKPSPAVRRGNQIFFQNEMKGGAADGEFAFGRPGDEVVVGDWDGDGKYSFGVVRDGQIFARNSMTGGPADQVIGR